MMTLKEELHRDTDEILLEVLAESASIAKEKILKDKDLSVENVIPLLLLSQYNHIAHLDAELKQGIVNLEQKVDMRFEKVDERFEKIDERFVDMHKSISGVYAQISNQTKWIFGMGVGATAILGGLISFAR